MTSERHHGDRPPLPRTAAAPLLKLLAAGLFLFLASPAHAYVGPGAGFAFLGSFLVLIVVFVLAILSLVAWPFRFLFRLFRGRKAYGKSQVRKLVIVGLDGMEPSLAEKYMKEGKLPNLAKLRDEGTYAPLTTTTPPISPVAWSSFMTGTCPAKHNIFDFLSRDPRTYLPDLSSASIGKPKRVLSLGKYDIPLSKPEIRGMRKSVPFWKILGDHGILCTILRVPITFPPEKFKGHLLSGMCAPDLKGSQGTFSFYTTDAKKVSEREGGMCIPLTGSGNALETYVSGPENTLLEKPVELRLPMSIALRPEAEEALIRVDGQEIALEKGKLSPWIRLTFKAGLGIKVRCICRFIVTRTHPHFEMYLSPLNIDPERPALPISHPFYYSVYLAKLFGSFGTLGLANDTWALNEGVLSEQSFLDLAYSHHAEWEKMTLNAMRKTRRGVVACVFETTDSIQHMFFRYLDPTHPALETGQAKMSAQVIEDLYRKMDDFVGRVRAELDDKSVVLVMSDHGFKPFRRGVNVNTWLLENGYLALEDGKRESGEWFRDVDWDRTRAYGLGLGGIYVNQKGREARGTVASGAEARALKKEIAAKLAALVDPESGLKPVNEVYDKDDVFVGPYRDNAPDLVVGYDAGYRASWDSVKGRVGSPVLSNNTKAWSGDHCIDAKVVPGVLFSSRKLNTREPRIWDIAPTALALFGIEAPGHMDGRCLVNADAPSATKERRGK